jgi:hypothetical protein
MHTCIDRGNSEVEAIMNPFFLTGILFFGFWFSRCTEDVSNLMCRVDVVVEGASRKGGASAEARSQSSCCCH